MKVWAGRLAVMIVATLAACAPTVPREALQSANVSYQAVVEASGPLLSELSVAERRNFAARWTEADSLRDGDLVVSTAFNPERASLYGTIGDPVLTAAVRRGLRVTGDYFRLLTVLADGTSIDAAQAQVGLLATSLTGLAAVATGGAAAPLAGAVPALQSLVRRWAESRNADELRRLVLDGAPEVDALLAELQAASGAMHATLIGLPAKAAEGALFDNKVARRAALMQIREANVAVANYVQLLGGLREELGTLVNAVRNPGSEMALASLSRSSANLLVQTQAAARVVEILRASGGAP